MLIVSGVYTTLAVYRAVLRVTQLFYRRYRGGYTLLPDRL